MHTMANHQQIQRKRAHHYFIEKEKKSEVTTLNRSAFEESENLGW